jgi:uncharacterized protein (TIGR02118 family)
MLAWYGMGRTSVAVLTLFYEHAPDRMFDAAYYTGHHLPLVARVWGAFLDRVEVLHGVASLPPGQPPAFAAIVLLHFRSDADLQAALASPEATLLQQDVARFAAVAPTGQINALLPS